MIEITTYHDAYIMDSRRFLLPGGKEFILSREYPNYGKISLRRELKENGYNYDLEDPDLPINQPMTIVSDVELIKLRKEQSMQLENYAYYRFTSERASYKCIAQYFCGQWLLIGETNPVSIEELNRRGWTLDSKVEDMEI